MSTTNETITTASAMRRSTDSAALRVAFRELELYDTGDVEGADEVFAPDLIDHNAAPDATSGIEGMRKLIAQVRDDFTGTQHRILFHRELPDGWVVLRWRMTATHTNGAPVDIEGMDLMRIVDGKMIEISHVEEQLKLVQQIEAGATPAERQA